MSPEKEGELFARIDMLIGLAPGFDARLRQLEIGQGEVRRALNELSKLLIALVPQTLAAVPTKKVAG